MANRTSTTADLARLVRVRVSKISQELQQLQMRLLGPRVSSLQVALSELAEGLVEAGQEAGVGSIP